MTRSNFVNSFVASFDSWLKISLRAISASWFIGLHLIGPVFFIATSWVVANIVGGRAGLEFFAQKSGIQDYLAFATVGFAFQSLVMMSIWNGSHAIRIEQQSGTAEAVFVTPSSKLAWLLGRIAAPVVFSLVAVSIVLVTGFLVFPMNLQALPDVLTAALGVLLTMAGMVSFSFVLAGVTFITKRESDINQVIWPTLIFFCGLAFPVEVLPTWAQTISYTFPLTHGLDITRKGILLGLGLTDPRILWRVGILILQILIYVPVGILIFRRMLQLAKKTGALGTY